VRRIVDARYAESQSSPTAPAAQPQLTLSTSAENRTSAESANVRVVTHAEDDAMEVVDTENSVGLCYQLLSPLEVTSLNGSLWATTAGNKFQSKKRAACKRIPRKTLQAGRVPSSERYEKSYCKYSEPEASSGLSLTFSPSSSTLFSHFVLPAFGLSPRWHQRQKQAEPAKNMPKTVVKPQKECNRLNAEGKILVE
jgi:hypothetical protein